MKYYAYAKINLALKIIGKRPDGYHRLDMLMQRISIADEITIEKSDGIAVRCDTYLPPVNTLTKAAAVFFEATGIHGGADMFVVKNIPEQAGLGGGSSDGAIVLMALNELYGAGLDKAQLIALGQKVGADVPFFMEGRCARAQGIGERLTPIKNHLNCVYLLAKPVGGVGTQEAYALYHQCKKQDIDMERIVRAVQAGDLTAYAQYAANSLAPVAMQICPDIVRMKSEFKNAVAALVTGSGSCAFGVYRDKKAARDDLERLGKLPFVAFAYLAENR